MNNLRYADDTTLVAESEEKLTSFLMRVKEESEKAGLKFNIKKIKPGSRCGSGLSPVLAPLTLEEVSRHHP